MKVLNLINIKNNDVKLKRKYNKESLMLYTWFSLFFILPFVRFMLTRVGLETGGLRESIILIISSIPLIFFFVNIKKIRIKKYLWFFVLLLTIICLMIISVILNPKLYEFYIRKSYGLDRILRPDSAIYVALFISLVDDNEKVLNILIKFAIFYFLYLILIDLIPTLNRGYWIDIGPDGRELKLDYNLSFGYNLTFPCIVFIYNLFRRNKKVYIIPAFISAYLILIYGNRGAMLVVILYVFLIILQSLKKMKLDKKVLIIGTLIVALILFQKYYDKLLLFLIRIANAYHIDSRSIRMIINGNFAEDNGREVIWRVVIDAIKSRPFLGYGILGDRPIVSPIHYVGYSHNLFLEIIISFGITGYLIISRLLFESFNMIFRCNDKKSNDLFIILFAVSSQLLISMSFWYVWEFWAAIAVCANYKRSIKNESTFIQNNGDVE